MEVDFEAYDGKGTASFEIDYEDFITDNEMEIIKCSISNKALANPLKLEDKLRANILRNIIVNILRED